MSVKLIWATPEADKHLAYIARVSNPANQANESIAGLLRYMEREGHVSPFTMCNMCVEVNTSRAIARQILRHWSIAPQEFCISGDSLVTIWPDSRNLSYIKIKDLYEYQFDNRMLAVCSWNARVFDEVTKTFVRAKIKEVYKVGVEEVFELITSDGKTIKATKGHKFLTRTGWKTLGEIKVGDLIGVNGSDCYKDYDWLSSAKSRTITSGNGGVATIAEEAGVSYHTIRKWLKKHGLGFSKKEAYLANGSKVWNKGLPPEQQPRYGQTCGEEVREKMAASARSGIDSEFSSGGVFRPLRQRSADWTGKRRLRLLREAGHACNNCGVDLTDSSEFHIDHIKPVSTHPELAFSLENLQVLCIDCHTEKSLTEAAEARKTVKWREVISLTAVGEETVYDLEVDHPSHNYVANRLVVHNSQRYQDTSVLGDMLVVECRMQDDKNRQNSIPIDTESETAKWFSAAQIDNNEATTRLYELALLKGIAKEQARCFLPEGNTPSRMYLNGNFRSWVHYLRSRLHPSTQKEHREVASKILEVFKEVAPITYEAFFSGHTS